MPVKVFFFGQYKNCAAYHAARCCEKALLRLGFEAYFKNSCQQTWQELVAPEEIAWSVSFGQVPEAFLTLRQQPHLHWHTEPVEMEFPWQHPLLWLGSPLKSTHHKHLFLPHAVEPIILPRLPVRFPIVLFDHLTEQGSLASFLDTLGPYSTHIFGQHTGANWLTRLDNAEKRFLHPPLPFCEHQHVLQQSQILILLQSPDTHASHPWVLPALSAGCLVLSTPTPYMQQLFAGYEELLVPFESLADQAQALLACPEKTQNLLERMQTQLLPQHSWEKRLGSLPDSCFLPCRS